MSSNQSIINYGTAKFQIVKNATSKDINDLNNSVMKIVVSSTQPQDTNTMWIQIEQEQQNQS